jgi:hypothetical protein
LNFLKLFAPLNFLPLDPSPSDTFLSLSLFNSKYLIDFSFFDINRHISGLNCKGIETNNLNKSLHNKTDTLSNLSKELSDFNNIKTEGSSVNFNSISKPETEIVKAGVILKDKLNTVESKDFVSNKSDKVEYNSLATSKTEINNAGSPKITSEACNVKGGFIARLKLKIKNYYRRILVGVKKGLSTPTLPPKTQNLIGNPLIRLIMALGSISMIICVTNQ